MTIMVVVFGIILFMIVFFVSFKFGFGLGKKNMYRKMTLEAKSLQRLSELRQEEYTRMLYRLVTQMAFDDIYKPNKERSWPSFEFGESYNEELMSTLKQLYEGNSGLFREYCRLGISDANSRKPCYAGLNDALRSIKVSNTFLFELVSRFCTKSYEKGYEDAILTKAEEDPDSFMH